MRTTKSTCTIVVVAALAAPAVAGAAIKRHDTPASDALARAVAGRLSTSG